MADTVKVKALKAFKMSSKKSTDGEHVKKGQILRLTENEFKSMIPLGIVKEVK